MSKATVEFLESFQNALSEPTIKIAIKALGKLFIRVMGTLEPPPEDIELETYLGQITDAIIELQEYHKIHYKDKPDGKNI